MPRSERDKDTSGYTRIELPPVLPDPDRSFKYPGGRLPYRRSAEGHRHSAQRSEHKNGWPQGKK